MSEPEISVRKMVYQLEVAVVGTDEQGRTVVICPHCPDEAPIEADGRIACPLGEAQRALAAKVLADLRPTPESPPPDWAVRPRGGRLPDPGLAAICAGCGEPREAHGGPKQLGACPGETGVDAKRFQLAEDDKARGWAP